MVWDVNPFHCPLLCFESTLWPLKCSLRCIYTDYYLNYYSDDCMDKIDFLKYRNSSKMGSDVDDYNSNSLNRKIVIVHTIVL